MRYVPPDLRILTAQGYDLVATGDLDQARLVLEDGFADIDFDDAGPEAAEAASLYARILLACGQPRPAGDWAAYAHSLSTELYGQADARTVRDAATLAAALQRAGSLPQAERLFRQVVRQLSDREGPDSAQVLAARADLATALHAMGDCTAGRAELADALTRQQQVYGPGTPAAIRMLARLAAMARDCHDPAAAARLFTQARTLCREHLPSDHPMAEQVAVLAAAPANAEHACGVTAMGGTRHAEDADDLSWWPPEPDAPAPRTAAEPEPPAPWDAAEPDPPPPWAAPEPDAPSPRAGPASDRSTPWGGPERDAPAAGWAAGPDPPGAWPGTDTRWAAREPADAWSIGGDTPWGAPADARTGLSRIPTSTPRSEANLPVPLRFPPSPPPRPRWRLMLIGLVLALIGVVGGWLIARAVIDRVAAPPATGGQSPTARTEGTPLPPSEVTLRDGRQTVTLTWRYPPGAEGPVVVSGGRSGQEQRAFQTLAAGSTSITLYGLAERTDYCFTVAVVYSTDTVARAEPVCTARGAAPPSPSR